MGAVVRVTFLQDTRNSSQFLWERGAGKRPFLEAGGRGLKKVKNEVNADVGGSGVEGRGDLSNAAPHRAEHD